MLIGLISDTHIPDRARILPQNVIDAFSDVELILHAGDLTSPKVIDELEEIAPVMAVQGNMDRANGIDLPKAKIVEVEGLKIGLIHGEVYPRADSDQLLYLAKELNVDILVSGHSHQPKIEQKEGILLILTSTRGIEMGSKWQMEKHNDPYYKKAKKEDYRSRASYKLKQLDKKYKLIKQGNTVVDLGAAPGGWSQVALEKVGEEGIVVGVDLNRFKKFHEENYYGIRGDFTTPEVQEKIMKIIGGKAKVVMSDASPSLCGIKNIDQLRSIDLTYAVIGIAENILEPKGNLVMKVFQGPEYKEMLDSLKSKFRNVRTTKPASSRKKSSEMYVVGLEYMPNKKKRKRK